ncbi:MAG: aspartate aminotransferase family protein [Alphaproteobacteria bacterium]
MKNRSAVFQRQVAAELPSIVRGEGCWLQDAAGRRWLDGSASAGVVGIGHGRREIWDALAAAGDRVTFVYNATFTHPWQEELAARILAMAPANMAGVYFVSGGSEANESAWKLARQYFVERGRPQKYKAIARWQSYHGVTLAALSLSGRTSWREMFSPLLLPVPHIAPPYAYRCLHCSGHGGCTLACADDLERAILLEGPETVAAFFAETIVGTTATGLVPDPGYYRRVREICDRYDVLFVADEVLCGYGRTGRPFAIDAWEDAAPDIITLGKALGAGYAPLAAMIVSERIREAFVAGSGRFVHGLTYSGTPAACFVGIQVHEIMRREDLFTRPARIGAHLEAGLRRLARRHEAIGDIRGRGLLWGVEFVADRATRRPFPESARFAPRLVERLRADGVLVAAGLPGADHGRPADHIQISPPFVISETEIDLLLDALDRALAVPP